MTLSEALNHLLASQPLSQADTHSVFRSIMQGECSPVQIAAFLTALRITGETVDEITGAALAMRDAAVAIQSKHPFVVDTCGTGGDGRGSLNISTAVAFVVAGAGFAVAKHGNRSISSKSGSADVLAAMGIRVELSKETAEACLNEVGLTFLFAPLFHPAMKHAMPVRKELGIRTIFNLLGPLTNPAGATVQLVGVYDSAWVEPLARALVKLGLEEGAVVHGEGYDEIILHGSTEVAEVSRGTVSRARWTANDFGFKASKELLNGGSATENASHLLTLLDGQPSAYSDAVCMNAAAAIRSAIRRRDQKTISLKEAAELARASIQSGRARAVYENLKRRSNA